VDKALRILKKMPKIIKSIKETENNEKNSYFNLGRNPMEILHGPFYLNKKFWSIFAQPGGPLPKKKLKFFLIEI
jgi:hypothetical protein